MGTGPPARSAYRISVERDGAVWRHLHDHIGIGDIIEVRAPDDEVLICCAVPAERADEIRLAI